MSTEVRVVFPDASAAQRSRFASALQDSLTGVPGVKTSVLRERPDTQDPGTILSVILAAPAIVATVKAIAAWLVRNNQSHVTIQTAEGTVVIKNMKSDDVPKAIEALKSYVKP